MSTARTHFKILVLAKMKQEVRSRNINLKPFYADQAKFFNSACFKGKSYTLINSPQRSPQKAITDRAHSASSEKTISAPYSLAHDLDVLQSRPSLAQSIDLPASKNKIIGKV